jgi:hypothetical protein
MAMVPASRPHRLHCLVQAPASTNVTVVPDTVQTAVVKDAKLTVRRDDAVALTMNGAVP